MELDLAGMHQLAAGQGIDPETLDAALSEALRLAIYFFLRTEITRIFTICLNLFVIFRVISDQRIDWRKTYFLEPHVYEKASLSIPISENNASTTLKVNQNPDYQIYTHGSLPFLACLLP